MARIRTIKPDFFTSEDIVSLSPLARLLFIALWLEADREGRLVWSLKTLKWRYLPGDDCDIAMLANELLEAGLVVSYVVAGKTYAEIPSFKNHQVINNREAASSLPARVADASSTRGARVLDAMMTPLRGKEGKGKEDTRQQRVKMDNDNGFATFWGAYPKKQGKQQAEKAWQKLAPNAAFQTVLMAALERQKASEQWQKNGGQFIPHPATWLNNQRWEDEIAPGVGEATIPPMNPAFEGAV